MGREPPDSFSRILGMKMMHPRWKYDWESEDSKESKSKGR